MLKKIHIYYLLYFLTAVGLLLFDMSWKVAPHHYLQPGVRYIHSTYNFTVGTFSRISSSFTVRRKLLARLQRNLDRLEELKYEHQRLEVENQKLNSEYDRLREQLKLPPEEPGRLVGGEIIQHNLGGWERTLRLNKGYNSGLEKNAPVFEARGDSWILRGRVKTVGAGSCEVILTTDPRFRIGAIIEDIPDRQFVLYGEGHRNLRINNFPEYLSLTPGQKVYTAPASTLAPSGFLIGTVEEKNSSYDFEAKNEVLITPIEFKRFPAMLWVLVSNE